MRLTHAWMARELRLGRGSIAITQEPPDLAAWQEMGSDGPTRRPAPSRGAELRKHLWSFAAEAAGDNGTP